MIYSDEDKKLVDQYKVTNKALRKQLNNLNNQIDRILIKKSMKLGLQKLPNVSKKITDPNIIQQEIHNLKKRLQNLQHDLQAYKSKAKVNYHDRIKQIQMEIRQSDSTVDDLRKLIKQYERKDKIADVQASKSMPFKTDKKIAKLQQQISRLQVVEKQLIKQISCQQVNEQKTSGYIQQLVVKHGQAVIKREKQQKQKQLSSPPKLPEPKEQASIGEEQWRDIKKQFLIFKESKQNEQFALNQQNERLRTEIKQWQRKIKDKKKRVQAVSMSLQKSKDRQSRIYSTLGDPNNDKAYRYRDKSNSIQYNTKQ